MLWLHAHLTDMVQVIQRILYVKVKEKMMPPSSVHLMPPLLCHNRGSITSHHETKRMRPPDTARTQWAPAGTFPAGMTDSRWPVHTLCLDHTTTSSSHLQVVSWVCSCRTWSWDTVKFTGPDTVLNPCPRESNQPAELTGLRETYQEIAQKETGTSTQTRSQWKGCPDERVENTSHGQKWMELGRQDKITSSNLLGVPATSDHFSHGFYFLFAGREAPDPSIDLNLLSANNSRISLCYLLPVPRALSPLLNHQQTIKIQDQPALIPWDQMKAFGVCLSSLQRLSENRMPSKVFVGTEISKSSQIYNNRRKIPLVALSKQWNKTIVKHSSKYFHL